MNRGRGGPLSGSGRAGLFGLLLWMAGCVSTAGGPKGDGMAPMRRQAAAGMRAAAVELESRGDLRGAREQWRLVRLLAPADPTVDRRIQGLGLEIEARVAAHVQRGRDARRRGQNRAAKREFLTALALDGSAKEAAEQLRAMERQRLGRVLQARVERLREEAEAMARRGNGDAEERYYLRQQELQSGPGLVAGPQPTADTGPGGVSKPEPANPSGPEQEARQHMETARSLNRKGEPEAALRQLKMAAALLPPAVSGSLAQMLAQTKAALAERHYARGVRVYAQDPAAAVAHWRKVLEFQPGHRKAGLRLRDALADHPELR